MIVLYEYTEEWFGILILGHLRVLYWQLTLLVVVNSHLCLYCTVLYCTYCAASTELISASTVLYCIVPPLQSPRTTVSPKHACLIPKRMCLIFRGFKQRTFRTKIFYIFVNIYVANFDSITLLFDLNMYVFDWEHGLSATYLYTLWYQTSKTCRALKNMFLQGFGIQRCTQWCGSCIISLTRIRIRIKANSEQDIAWT